MSETTQRMLKEREDNIKRDPKPLKLRVKKYTLGRGQRVPDDGRADPTSLIEDHPPGTDKASLVESGASTVIGGGIMRTLFARVEHPSKEAIKRTDIRTQQLTAPLE